MRKPGSAYLLGHSRVMQLTITKQLHSDDHPYTVTILHDESASAYAWEISTFGIEVIESCGTLYSVDQASALREAKQALLRLVPAVEEIPLPTFDEIEGKEMWALTI